MSSTCKLISVGVVSPVSETLLLSKTSNFPFQGMVIKKFNRSEFAQKFMQVGIDVKCMHTNFGGRGLSDLGDIATFKNSKFSLSGHGTIVHGHQKI